MSWFVPLSLLFSHIPTSSDCSFARLAESHTHQHTFFHFPHLLCHYLASPAHLLTCISSSNQSLPHRLPVHFLVRFIFAIQFLVAGLLSVCRTHCHSDFDYCKLYVNKSLNSACCLIISCLLQSCFQNHDTLFTLFTSYYDLVYPIQK